MNRLKQLRTEKKLTQEELASEIGVSKITILRWENGERQIKSDKAQGLADYFGVSVAYLLDYESKQQSINSNYENLSELIKVWSDERSLTKADPKIQWMKVTEEVGEIRDVLLNPNKFENPDLALKDAIRDSLVTLIVLAHQLNLDTVECLEIAYNEIKDRQGKMVNGTFVKERKSSAKSNDIDFKH